MFTIIKRAGERVKNQKCFMQFVVIAFLICQVILLIGKLELSNVSVNNHSKVLYNSMHLIIKHTFHSWKCGKFNQNLNSTSDNTT